MDLLTRNVAQVVEKSNLERKLKAKRKLVIKLGRDPRTGTLTLGHSVPLRKLRQFQIQGHQIVIVIGDFTARLGDPNAADAGREVLSRNDLEKNVREIKKVFAKILDPKKTKFTYNSAWLEKLKFDDLIRLASRFTVQQNIERDLFQNRIKLGKPIGLQEFLYPLMQAYDSVFLKPDLEVGGTDQTFNLLAARQLMKAEGLEPQDILTVPMLTGTDGREMHSSWGNTINLTDNPTDMFGKLMGVRDDLIISYLTLTTDMDQKEIDTVAQGLKSGTIHPIEAKKMLAREIVTLYHGGEAATAAQAEFERVIQAQGIPTDTITFTPGHSINIIELLVESGLVKSRSEARRLVEQGGVDQVEQSRNGQVLSRQTIHKIESSITPTPIGSDRTTVIQVGKRKAVAVV